VPFVIRWMDEAHFSALPPAGYGVTLAMTSVGYILLEKTIVACNGPNSALARAVGSDWKSVLSLVVFAVAIGLAFVRPWLAIVLYVAIALMWFVPDRRIERTARK
jgi:uncharacterized membrane protein